MSHQLNRGASASRGAWLHGRVAKGARLISVVMLTFMLVPAAFTAQAFASSPCGASGTLTQNGGGPYGNQYTCTYGPTGNTDTFTVPSGQHIQGFLVTAVGGNGSAAMIGTQVAGQGGAGAKLTTTLGVGSDVHEGDTLTINVGANGNNQGLPTYPNGGAASGGGAGSGGGSTMLTDTTSSTPLAIAGGGGGAGNCVNSSGTGANGGNAGSTTATLPFTPSDANTGSAGSACSTNAGGGAAGNSPNAAGGAGQTSSSAGGGGGGHAGGAGGHGNGTFGFGAGGGAGSSFSAEPVGAFSNAGSSDSPSIAISWTVPIPITVTAGNQSIVYGTPSINGNALSVTSGSLVNGDTLSSLGLTVTSSYAPGHVSGAAGSVHPLIVTAAHGSLPGIQDNGNYYVTPVNGALTITPAPITISAANQTVGFNQPFTGSSPTCSTVANVTTGSGVVDCYVAGQYASPTNGDTIETAASGVTLQASTYSPGAAVGSTFPIVPVVSGANNSNYSVSAGSSGVLTVVQASTTVTVSKAGGNGSITYGTPVSFTATVTNNTSNTPPTGSVTFVDTTDGIALGSYALTACGSACTTATATTSLTTLLHVHAGGDNILAVYQGAASFGQSNSDSQFQQVVNPAALTASAVNQTIFYGQSPNYALGNNCATGTICLTGSLFNGDSDQSLGLSLATNYSPGPNNDVGRYALYLVGGNGDADYAVTIQNNPAILTVNPASVGVSVAAIPNSPVTYGTTVTFLAGATNNSSGALPAGSIEFVDNTTNKVLDTEPVSGGQAKSIPITLGATVPSSGDNILALFVPNTVNLNDPSSGPGLSTGTGGSLGLGTYYVKYAWLYSDGNVSKASPEASVSLSVCSGTGCQNPNSISVSLPSFPGGALGAAIFISTASGSEREVTALNGANLGAMGLTGHVGVTVSNFTLNSYTTGSATPPSADVYSVRNVDFVASGAGSTQIVVNKATLTFICNNTSVVYGMSPFPALTSSVNGVVDGDTNITTGSGTCTTSPAASSTTPAGSYAITAGNGTLALTQSGTLNYTLGAPVGGTLTVTQRPVTVAAGNGTRTYGAAAPAISGTITGLVNSDSVTASCSASTATATSAVGMYPVDTCTLGGAAAGNYTVSSVTKGILTVTPALVTVIANNASAQYGAAIPALTGAVSGAVNGETLGATCATTATSASPVGSYAINGCILTGSTAGNYTISSQQAGVLQITPAPLTIEVNPGTVAYGAPIPPFTATGIGLVNGDSIASAANPNGDITVTFTSTLVQGAGPGQYFVGIMSIGGSALNNYTLTLKGAEWTVTSGTTTQLTITADSATITAGQGAPKIGYTVSGLQNGDQLTAAPTCVVINPDNGNVIPTGHKITYARPDPTRCGGASAPSQYTIKYVDGTLTVNAPTTNQVTITAQSKTITVGQKAPAIGYNVTGLNGGHLTVKPICAIINPDNGEQIHTGRKITYARPDPTRCSGASAASQYTIKYVDGTLTVNSK